MWHILVCIHVIWSDHNALGSNVRVASDGGNVAIDNQPPALAPMETVLALEQLLESRSRKEGVYVGSSLIKISLQCIKLSCIFWSGITDSSGYFTDSGPL